MSKSRDNSHTTGAGPSKPAVTVDNDYDHDVKENLSAITVRNATESPLLRLPLELRSMIYWHLFGDAIVIVKSVNCEQCKPAPRSGRRDNLWPIIRTLHTAHPSSSTASDTHMGCDYCSVMYMELLGQCPHPLQNLPQPLYFDISQPGKIFYPATESFYLKGWTNSIADAPNNRLCPIHYSHSRTLSDLYSPFSPASSPSTFYSSSSPAKESTPLSPGPDSLPAPSPVPVQTLRVCRQISEECWRRARYRTAVHYVGSLGNDFLGLPLPRPTLVLPGIRTLRLCFRKSLHAGLHELRQGSGDCTYPWTVPAAWVLRQCFPRLETLEMVSDEREDRAREWLVERKKNFARKCDFIARSVLYGTRTLPYKVEFRVRLIPNRLELDDFSDLNEYFARLSRRVEENVALSQQQYRKEKLQGYVDSEEDSE